MARLRSETPFQPLSARVPAVRGERRKKGGKLQAPGRRKDDEAEEDWGDEEDSAGAWLPTVVFFLLVGLLGAIAVVEIRNGFRHPSVHRVSPPAGAPALTLYQKGHASAREAWLFDEPQGTSGPPRLIQRIDCRLQATDIGEIRWTADGRAVYAAGREPLQRGVPVVRWLFEFELPRGKTATKSPAVGAVRAQAMTPSSGRLYLSAPEYAVPGRTAFVEDAAALTARWRQHGGAGGLVAAWYDLGAKGPRLFSWQTTRWENLLPD